MAADILLTSVGRRVELVRAFRDAYARLGVDGRVLAVDCSPLAPALAEADAAWIVPRIDASDYIPTLCKLIERERVAAVFPLIDPEIPVLAEHRERLEQAGARVAVVSPEAASLTADKWHTTQFFRRLGLKVPRTWLPESLDATGVSPVPGSHGAGSAGSGGGDRPGIERPASDGQPPASDFPLIVKPRRGSAGQHVFRVDHPHELEFFRQYVADHSGGSAPIIQEFLPRSPSSISPEVTSDVVCDLDGRLLAVVSRERIRVREGEVLIGRTVYDERITDACVAIAAALPAVGPITVQCIMKDDQPHFTEINARLGGGLPLSIAAGADIPRWLLASIVGCGDDVPPLGTYRRGVTMTRFDQSHFFTEADRERMASRRV